MGKTDNIRLSKSILGEEEVKSVRGVLLNDGYLGMGKYVRDFEEKLKKYFNRKHVICVNSGSAALHLALMALGLKENDEVLVQSLTFVSCFQAIKGAGAVPVACEITPATCTIDLNDAERRLTNNTKAIMPVHYASRVGDLDAIFKFAKKNKLRVVEDAAHAFGTIYNGKRVGSFGDISCFSFDGIKNITCGEGGAVVTDDDKIAEFVMDARLLGVEKDTAKRYQGLRSWEFDVTHQGYRYHMSNIFAAIGLAQLKRLEKEFKPKRQRFAKYYHDALKGVNGVMLFPDNYKEIVPHIFPIRILGNKRNALRQYLLDNNIECGVHYYPNHLLTLFAQKSSRFPITERVYSELLTLPLHPDLNKNMQNKVISCVKNFMER